MIGKYLNLNDASKVDPEHIDLAYTHLKQYCDLNNLDVVEFVNKQENIPIAAAYVHKELPFAIRLIMSKNKIESLISTNIEFIRQKAVELENKDV